MHTGVDLLTDKQAARLSTLFGRDEHVQVEATWRIYQQMIAAYRDSDRARGRSMMTKLVDALSSEVPAPLIELRTLGRTLKRGAADVLAYFERPGTSNGPTEDQRPTRAPPWQRPRVPQPHQLHRQITARGRRLQTTTTPSIVKSQTRRCQECWSQNAQATLWICLILL